MSDAVVSVDSLGGAITALCREYEAELEEQVRADVDAAAEVALEQLRSGSPRSGARRRHYADGWVADDDSDSLLGYGVRIHNRAKPGLTHLLEKGHGGPRPAGAHPHIAPAARAGEEELKRRIADV